MLAAHGGDRMLNDPACSILHLSCSVLCLSCSVLAHAWLPACAETPTGQRADFIVGQCPAPVLISCMALAQTVSLC